MNRFLANTILLAAALVASTASADVLAERGPAAFQDEAALAEWAAPAGDTLLLAQGADCSGAAAQAAAETGGEVLSVSSRGSGPDAECVVTVLVPGQAGGRPRKQTITVRP